MDDDDNGTHDSDLLSPPAISPDTMPEVHGLGLDIGGGNMTQYSQQEVDALLQEICTPTSGEKMAGFDAPSDNSDFINMFMNFSSDGVVPPEEQQVDGAMEGLDFSQFWDTVMPLVQDQENQNGQEAGEIDHVKLAEDVQALFSGCVA